MNITSLSARVAAASRRTRVIAATTLAALALVAMASAAPSAHAATTQPATTVTASNGDHGEFHCGPGQVTFDFLVVPPGTGLTYYQPRLYIYYGGAWHFDGYMPEEILYNYYNIGGETPITVSVPHGYPYAVNVWASSSAQIVNSFVDQGVGAGGYSCTA